MSGEVARKDRPAKRPREGSSFASGFIGGIIEAWDELRVHRTRVLLSLIGVGVAVCALTSVVGIGAIAQQSQIEQLERGSGRPATLVLGAPYDPATGTQADKATFEAAVATAIDRYKIDYHGTISFAQQNVQFIDGASLVDTQAVDVDYGTMHRIQVEHGRWFGDRDELRLAPALVVNAAFYERLGSPDLRTSPTVTLLGASDVTAVIVGVTPAQPFEEGYLRMFMLNSAYTAIASPDALSSAVPQVELWVPPELAEQLTTLLQRDITAAFGDGWQVDVFRQDYLSWPGGGDPLGPIRLVLAGISVLILLLGALGLVNISLVTVRQRIREIGIRRSFGATARRVFFAVMMESVVATVVAGAAGVLLAVLIVQNPMVRDFVAAGLNDVPPFPVEAAIIGLGAATAVGALAGLLPALVAVRVKVIDAIRY
ncbi:MAG: transporter permease [Rhodoglobus sp.]|nr:transporter permease [Rhodoglobus sp.]